MKIRIQHQHVGSALMQIAEHTQFTAINAMQIAGQRVNNAFKINNDIGLLCKYASEPNPTGEYVFTFQKDHIAAIAAIAQQHPHTFIALICVEDGEICCLSNANFLTLIQNREKSAGAPEETYQILVKIQQGKSLRVYVNASGRKGRIAGSALTVPRSAFPEELFN